MSCDDDNMSAYGSISRPISQSSSLATKPLIYDLAGDKLQLVVFPVSPTDLAPELEQYLQCGISLLFIGSGRTLRQSWIVFNAVVEEGLTYPQEEELTAESFRSYFLCTHLHRGQFETHCDQPTTFSSG